jgi:hypothetical protein
MRLSTASFTGYPQVASCLPIAGTGARALDARARLPEAQNHPMMAPGAAYYLHAAVGILVSLGIIAATFPLLARITGPEVARNA